MADATIYTTTGGVISAPGLVLFTPPVSNGLFTPPAIAPNNGAVLVANPITGGLFTTPGNVLASSGTIVPSAISTNPDLTLNGRST
jgi:hypothetical protein